MFDQHGSFLQERIDPDSGLLDKLLANKTLSKIEYDGIKVHHLFYERNARLLDYISQKKKHDSLIDALRDTHQTHLVNYLIGNEEYKSEYGGEWPLTEKELSVLDTNRESLVDLIDCSDLLIRLYSAQVINARQRETISSEPTNHRRNEALLDILRRRSIKDYKKVVRCLHESNQSHVAEILDKGGVVVRVHAELGNDKSADHTEDDIITRFRDVLNGKSLNQVSRILKEIELSVIAAKKGQSVVLYIYCRTVKELMDLYEICLSGKLRDAVERLFSQLLLCSTSAEYAEVTVENLNDVVECALTQLLYRSQMKKLTVSLSTNEYKNCRAYFSDECHLVRAVCNFDQRKIGRREYEEMRNTIRWLKIEGDAFSKVLSFKKGDYMMTTAPEDICGNGVWWKVEHIDNGRIGYILRNCIVIDYSEGIKATNKNLSLLERPTTTVINSLPLELLDMILQKSYLHYALNRDRFKNQSDRSMVTRLATVDHCWSERLKKRRFKSTLWRRLSLALNKLHRVTINFRSNESFLVETMRLGEGLINQLRLCDCLTDVQSRLLNRQTVTSGKRKLISRNNSSDLLHVIRSCDDTKRSDCFRYLRQSGQTLVTKVVDNGGVVLKVNLCCKKAEVLQQLCERLNDLHDKTKLRSNTMERAMGQLIDSGIEIFHSQMDRQASLSIWCKSQLGHDNFRTLCESNLVVDIIGDLTKMTSSAPEPIGSRKVDVDKNQFKKTIIICPIVVRFTARLGVNDDEEVKGVTVLRQEICVLCGTDSVSPHAIRVFQNRHPFRLNAKIDIGEFVEFPQDIGSSDVENCFFVVDSEGNSVWQIARQGGNLHKLLQLESTYFQRLSRLSVSCDGLKLLLLARRSLAVVGVFGPEGATQEALLSVELPSDIDKPLHAVETSSGHFIVLHSLENDVGGETAESDEEEKKRMFVVSKMTRDGRLVVRRFLPQNKTQELNHPHYLALDADDRVFVADEENHRVVLLDSDLSWVRIPCPTEDEGKDYSMPNRLCYDRVERQLIVAGFFGREVNVYRIDMK